MIDLCKKGTEAQSAKGTEHAEAIELLSKNLLVWYHQIREFESSDIKDRAAHAAALRKRCHAIEASIKFLETPKVESQEGVKL